MRLLTQLTQAAYLLLIALVLIGALACGLIFYNLKLKKKNRMKEDVVDYSGLKRVNAMDFVKIDDICDNMIVLEGGKRFAAVIRCRGYDFYSAQTEEQSATIENFLGFINVITKPVTYRQYCRAVDLEDTMAKYQSAYQDLEKGMNQSAYELAGIDSIVAQGGLSPADQSLYLKEQERFHEKLETTYFRLFHLKDQMDYMQSISGRNVDPEIGETWVFDWTFNEVDFSVSLTPEEVHARAVQELHAMSCAYIHSLSNCRVSAVRCSTEELIEMFRRYSSPVSSDRYKLQDIINSSYFEDISASDSPQEILLQNAKKSFEDGIEGVVREIQPKDPSLTGRKTEEA